MRQVRWRLDPVKRLARLDRMKLTGGQAGRSKQQESMCKGLAASRTYCEQGTARTMRLQVLEALAHEHTRQHSPLPGHKGAYASFGLSRYFIMNCLSITMRCAAGS